MPVWRAARLLRWSLALLLGVSAGLTLTYLVATRTGAGRAWLTSVLLTQANAVFGGRGALRVGTLREISPCHIVADDVALLDTAGVPVMTAARVRGTLNVRDLFDRAIHLRRLDLEGVVLTLQQDTAGRPWNLAYIISGDHASASAGPPGFGDDVRIDQVGMRDVVIGTRAPWAPHPIFTGAARDSVITVRDSLHDLVRDASGALYERRQIALTRAVAHDVVIVERQRRPASLVLDSLVGRISDPPVQIRQARGRIVWTDDSLQLDLTDVHLPGSRGRARGMVAWHQPGPVQFDVVVDAEAALADLAWIWDVMPREGRGRATVRMRTLADAYDAEYALQNLHVESGRSVIDGQVAVIVRPAELRLHGVDLRFAPLNVTLARRLSYGVIPAAITGVLSGRLLAPVGGPLTAFAIERLEASHVSDPRGRSEPSTLRLTGTVGFGVVPRASNLAISDMRMSLPVLRHLVADAAPSLWPDGILTGRVTLRSADLSHVNVTAMDIGWTDAVGHQSRVRGALQSRFGRAPMTVRGTLDFAPLSLAALARLDSAVSLRRDLSGTLTLDGTSRDLAWRVGVRPMTMDSIATDARGGIDAMGTASVVDTAWSVNATGTLQTVDLRDWLGDSVSPRTAISGAFRIAADGALAASGHPLRLAGHIDAQQDPAPDRPGFRVGADGALREDRLVIDSLVLRMAGIDVSARGALARHGSGVDTMQLRVDMDSLAAVRADLARMGRMFTSLDTTLARTLGEMATDSLRGDASLAGYLHGSLDTLQGTLAFGARAVRVGAQQVGRLLGSLELRRDSTLTVSGAITADDVRGLGAVTLQSTTVRLTEATPRAGQVDLTIRTDADASLHAGGGYLVAAGDRRIAVDSLRLAYDGMTWRTSESWRVIEDSTGWRMTPFALRSEAGGAIRASGTLPQRGAAIAVMELERVPFGEFASLLSGAAPVPGVLSGRAELSGTRASPAWRWSLVADSLGTRTVQLPRVVTSGAYRDRRAIAQVAVRDSMGGRLQLDAEIPVDLSFDATGARLLDEALRGQLRADSLRLDALPFRIQGMSQARGVIAGRFDVSGTVDAPRATGVLTMTGAGARIETLGIEPRDGQLSLRAEGDSISLLSLSIRSGGDGDTVGVHGVLHLPSGAATQRTAASIDMAITAQNFEASRQRDGTDLDISGAMRVAGSLKRPVVRGTVTVPAANIVVDPLGARTALDLSTAAARALIGAEEVPVAESAAESFAQMGRYVAVENARVDLGNAVWVQTPESKVKLGGGLSITMQDDRLALDGEILATRGQYRLDLGVVTRSFAIDSGRVRFFGQAEIPPTLDITATNVVRLAGGSEIPVRVHIGGNYDRPVLSLSSRDPLYASAPESEIISLLLFGAPTFALDGQSQSTVRAVTGVLLPSVGGAMEGALQRLLPVFNTVQVTTAGGQTAGQLSALSLLDNLSISAGKQLGDRTFLRLNTGVCRTAGATATRGASLWYGAAAEYRFSALWSAQIGVDPGASPCTRLGPEVLPRMQFGFDLFREWIW